MAVAASFQTIISLYHEDQGDNSPGLHSWHFDAASIKSISHYRRNSKAVFLYVYENSDDFHIFFPSEQHKQRSVGLNVMDSALIGNVRYYLYLLLSRRSAGVMFWAWFVCLSHLFEFLFISCARSLVRLFVNHTVQQKVEMDTWQDRSVSWLPQPASRSRPES